MELLENDIFYLFASVSFIMEQERLLKIKGQHSDYLEITRDERMGFIINAHEYGWRTHFKA